MQCTEMRNHQPRYLSEATLDSIGDAVLSTDLDGRVTYLNVAAERMTGWANKAATGQPLTDVFRIIDGDTRQTARNPLALALKLNRAVGLTPDCILVRRDGHECAIEDSATPIHDRAGRLVGAVIVFRDVGTALESSRHMAHLAQHDPLTGLPNRLLLSDRLTEAIALAQRHKKPLGVLFVDVDGFKALNDAHGHAMGDLLLRATGDRLKGMLRQSDTVCRNGGDEFVVVLSELERAEDALLVARKLLRGATEPNRLDSAEISLTVSIGISLYPRHGVTADALIANADAAMYIAKRAGPGGYRLFQPGATPENVNQWEADGGALASKAESRPPGETTTP
jgi:diguanylate cyclase (GGDEF)-like protein/PAS domain S-box-containing protein